MACAHFYVAISKFTQSFLANFFHVVLKDAKYLETIFNYELNESFLGEYAHSLCVDIQIESYQSYFNCTMLCNSEQQQQQFIKVWRVRPWKST